MTIKITENEFIDAVNNSKTMAQAAASLKIQFCTFKRYATKYGIYKTNQGSKGVNKPKADGAGKIPLADILGGLHPQYQSFKLKVRLFEAGLKENICEECGIAEWNNLPISLELDHIDGDRTNHLLCNLKILCPNCHSQTPTFRFKRGKTK